MTNREYMLELLEDAAAVDDGGSSYECLLTYHVACPYITGDERASCYHNDDAINRDTCYECKEKWLNSEVDQ